MLRIAACDSSAQVRGLLISWIHEWLISAGMTAECFAVTDAEDLLYEFCVNGQADLLFSELDAEGSGMTETIRSIKKTIRRQRSSLLQTVQSPSAASSRCVPSTVWKNLSCANS